MNKSVESFSKMEMVESYREILEALENFVKRVYSKNPKLHDHDVLRVYEALIKYYKAKLTNYQLPNVTLTGVCLELYTMQITFLQELKGHGLNGRRQCISPGQAFA